MNKFQSDIEKYKMYSQNKSTFLLLLATQGLWALFVYRISNRIFKSRIPKFLKKLLLVGAVIHQKVIELFTGITLPYSATIGKRFYIAHYGSIIIHPNAIIGENCNIRY